MKKSPQIKSNLLQKIKENKFVIILFILTTAFFLYQHAVSLSWDFGTYVLNGKYWFADGKYFEILRPPLMPLLLGMFSFLGWKASEFIFILIVSVLFAYSSVKLAKSINFHPAAFYALSLNFYLLNYGLINGTELLSLVFLELFIAFLIENKYSSGLVLALSVLSRYTSLAFFPLIFLHLKIKDILKSLVLFGAVISLWFLYNFYKFGNFFTSIADQYANNILYRGYITQQAQLSHFLEAQNMLIPFFILGLIIIAVKFFKTLKSEKSQGMKYFFNSLGNLKVEIIMIFLLVYSVSSYNNIPIKGARYLFSLVLPTIYFSYIGIGYLVEKIGKKERKTKTRKKHLTIIASMMTAINFAIALIILASIILTINFAMAIHGSFLDYDPPQVYVSAINKMNELNLSGCTTESNSWIKLGYYGLYSFPISRFELVNSSIEKKHIIILFKREGEPKYIPDNFFINSVPDIYRIHENEEYLIMGSKNCKLASEFSTSYVHQVDNYIFEVHKYHINTNPCFTMFHNSSFLEKTCNFVNFKGFRKDENRLLE